MSTKKYASLETLSIFLDNLKNTFPSIDHNHSWEDLEDRPFYTAAEYCECIPEQSVTIGDEGYTDNVTVTNYLEEGKTYTVLWNGVEYTCLARYDEAEGVIYIGNQVLVDWITFSEPIESDEPFCMIMGGDWLEIYSNSGTYTFSVHINEEVVKIPEKYLPDGILKAEDIAAPIQSDWSQKDDTQLDYIKNKPFYDNSYTEYVVTDLDLSAFVAGQMGSGTVAIPYDVNLIDGQTYHLVYGGKTYSAVATTLGNGAITVSFTDVKHIDDPDGNGMYFTIVGAPGNYLGTSGGSKYPNSGTLSVYTEHIDIKQIDEKLIPDTIPRKEELLQTPDWRQNDKTTKDYIKNRTHYVAEESIDELISEMTVLINVSTNTVNFPGYLGYTAVHAKLEGVDNIDFVVGDDYIITCDGVDYRVTATGQYDLAREEYVSENIPANISRHPDGYMIAIARVTGNHTISLSHVTAEIIKELDERFIPHTIARKEDIPAYEEASSLMVTNEGLSGSTPALGGYEWYRIPPANKFVSFEVGKTYEAVIQTVDADGNLDGSVVKVNAVCNDSGIIKFSYDCAYDTPVTNMWVVSGSDYIGYVVYSDNMADVIYVYDGVNAIKQLDEKFIPDTIARKSDIENIDLSIYSPSDHNHDNAYDAKGAADTALASAKTYADEAVAAVKNDLLNGAGEAYDTLKELGDLINDNQDAIEALENIATGKADATHQHAISDVTGLQDALDGKAASEHTHGDATTSAAGFMTAAMVTKLDGIETGANKTIVDETLSDTSTNPVQNKVLTSAINSATSAISANTSSIASHTEAIAALQTKVGDGFEEITSAEIQALFA